MTARPTGPARLTPAQERMLCDWGRRDHGITSRTYQPALKLASLGLIEPIEATKYANMQFWRITPAGRAWLAARDGEDGIKD